VAFLEIDDHSINIPMPTLLVVRVVSRIALKAILRIDE